MHRFPCLARALRYLLLMAALGATVAQAQAQDSLLERGRYLVTTVMACGNCHTPKDADGRPVAGRELAGGGLAVDIPPFAVSSANITPDVETGIGAWTDAEIKRAIVHGERPAKGPEAGKPLAAIMAANFFKALLPRNLDAIVVYLRSVPAAGRSCPRSSRARPRAGKAVFRAISPRTPNRAWVGGATHRSSAPSPRAWAATGATCSHPWLTRSTRAFMKRTSTPSSPTCAACRRCRAEPPSADGHGEVDQSPG